MNTRDCCESLDTEAHSELCHLRQCPFCQGDGDWKGEVCGPCGGTGEADEAEDL